MMSCKVEKFQGAKKRKGLRATVSVSPGEVLYVAEPFVYTVKETVRGSVCEFCLMSKDHLLRCSQCKYAKYCSKLCQTKAWPDHKRECKCLDGVFTSDHVDTFRLAIRVIFKMIRNAPCPSENLCSMSQLECNPSENIRQLENITPKLLGYMKEEIAHPSELPDELDLTKILSAADSRFSIILNDSLTLAGVGIYPSMCPIKHSCEPNCFIAFMGSTAHLRSIRKIQAGEELTVYRFQNVMPSEQRQSLLGLLYCFKCTCHQCTTGYMDKIMLAGDKQASDQTRDTVKVLNVLRSKKQWQDVLLVCRTQLERNADRVPDVNFYQQEVLHCAMEACLILGLPKEGLPYAYRALESCKMHSYAVNFESASLMTEIASLECLDGNVSKASKIIRKAAEIYEFFLGRNHPYVKRLREDD